MSSRFFSSVFSLLISFLSIPFSVLTLLVQQQEGYQEHSRNPRGSYVLRHPLHTRVTWGCTKAWSVHRQQWCKFCRQQWNCSEQFILCCLPTTANHSDCVTKHRYNKPNEVVYDLESSMVKLCEIWSFL